MKILHYSLGFPPYRSGGLTKYATDLMEEQVKQGHSVSLLWPGQIGLLNKKHSIKHSKGILGIESYEIINPLPVPLLNGIEDIDSYTEKCNKSIYKDFLEGLNPEVIHIHTLMGIHKEFFEVAKELKIKMVYTSHDYFGICPKVNLLYNDLPCDDNKECLNCSECNKYSLSKKKITILQSPIYRKFKTSKIVKSIREKYKKKNTLAKKIDVTKDNNSIIGSRDNNKYIELRKYYLYMFNLIDTFHFNSSLARDIYLKYIDVKNYKVISILHKDIKDNRRIKEFTGKLKITYLGPAKSYKGFYLLKNALDSLYNDGLKDLELNIYSPTCDTSKYMNVYDGYNYSELERIFEKTDLLVVPSVWYETFGFVTIEAYSYGIPSIVTSNVGAKDILDSTTAYIVKSDEKDIKYTISYIYNNRKELVDMNRNINNKNINLKFNKHVLNILNMYDLR